jgi:hypothetical protein
MIGLIWALEGSGKSSFGLTWPKPLYHMEFDIGGFDRAAWRLPEGTRVLRLLPHDDVKSVDWSKWDIVTKPYPLPVQLEKLLGTLQSAIKDNKVTLRPPRQVTGYKELWEELVIDFVNVCQAKEVKTIMPDSSTKMWEIAHQSVLQDKQAIKMATGMKTDDPNFPYNLQPMDYPNDRIEQMVATARAYGKNIIGTHYPKDVYKTLTNEKGQSVSMPSGEKLPDGFKHTLKISDVAFWAWTAPNSKMYLDDAKKERNPNYGKPEPHVKIDLKCGLPMMGMSYVGYELAEPTYDYLQSIISMLRGE